MKRTNYTGMPLLILGIALTATQTRAQLIYTPYAFTNFAGISTASGTANGTGTEARFNSPMGVGVDSAGNLYVADTFNHTIRKATPNGNVTTLAGSPSQSGTNDGTGSLARFKSPYGVAVDSTGNLYVADEGNHTIRRITPAGTNWVVTTLAGSPGQPGTNDGLGSVARFFLPQGVAVDGGTNVYVADTFNETIRKITPAGDVTTLAGGIRQIGSIDGVGSEARFHHPGGVGVDAASNIYVADTDNYTIRKITSDGMVTTLAGSAGQTGRTDGNGSSARFGGSPGFNGAGPHGVALDSVGNVYVGDTQNHLIRRISQAGDVRTLAGIGPGTGTDGIGPGARFYNPGGLALDSAGKVYVADTTHHRVSKGTPTLRFDSNSLAISNGVFWMRLNWTGPFSSNSVVEASADRTTWTLIQTNTLAPEGLDVFVAQGTNQQQFFRGRLAP
jgi:hypothetical protein